MIKEIIDKDTGAILFKKDADTLRYEEIIAKLDTLEKRVKKLEKSSKSSEK